MLFFNFLATAVVFLGIFSLRNGFSFARYIRRERDRQLPAFAPYASVIAPLRGAEKGLSENLSAFCEQSYPAYEVIFVTDRADDPSVAVIEETISAMDERSAPATRIVIAGAAVDSGQKVHNLRIAVAQVNSRTEVLVFVDSDARPHSDWLKSLVAPLVDERIGATTGYRWFIAKRGNVASHLRSVWNASIASALGANKNKNFCWGGSTAIRRSTFERLKISEAWRGSISDDFALTRVLQQARLPIHFVPACLTPTFGACSIAELFEFTNRQLKITRIYAPHLWRPLLLGSLLFTAAFFGGLALIVCRAIVGLDVTVPLLLVIAIFALGSVKAFIRLKAVGRANRRETMNPEHALWHLISWPLASALFLLNAIVAGFSRRIVWRGITYELKSADEAVIIRRQET